MTLRHFFITGISLLMTAAVSCAEKDRGTGGSNVAVPEEIDVKPTRWSALDALGRVIEPDSYPDAGDRAGKQVGLFYFLWHGCHGYDRGENHEDVVLPSESDTRSPYNNELLWEASPQNPAFGPAHAMHHWSEPYFGYYLSNDTWVMRRHVRMLGAAGVDFLALDMTNGFTYLPVVERLFEAVESVDRSGGKVPKICFMTYADSRKTVQKVYDAIYRTGRFEKYWYRLDGKPLILSREDELTQEQKSFFTVRTAWFASHGFRSPSEGDWFVSSGGEGKWTWADYWPQQPGLHDGKPEEISIVPATHPHMNIGRSFDAGTGTQPERGNWDSGRGLYFARQMERALEVDPDIVFITGWNEWTAQRQVYDVLPVPENGNIFRTPEGGYTFFVDQFNEEFSRDIEPMRGGFGDSYYYQMADFIRRYKGVDRQPAAMEKVTLSMDGNMEKWRSVPAVYDDYAGDTDVRNAVGWGNEGSYSEKSGRNDFVRARVASDDRNLYFCMECGSDISRASDGWMMLYISVSADEPSWEGFNYVVNRKCGILERCLGGWDWKEAAEVDMRVSGKSIEMAVPLETLGIKNPSRFSIDFKWMDNTCGTGDIQECMDKGDAAPDGRFRYRYTISVR